MKTFNLAVLVCTLNLGTCFCLKAQTAEGIVAKHLKAIGGAESRLKINTLKIVGIGKIIK